MPNTSLGRSRTLNLNLCFTKIKRPQPPHSSLPPPLHHSRRPFLITNFNSLYEDNNFEHNNSSDSPSSSASSSSEPDLATVLASQRFFFSSPGRSNSIIESTPSIATTSTESNHEPLLVDTYDHPRHLHNHDRPSYHESSSPAVKDSVAVPTISPDPYTDFRRSMQEMVEARELGDVKENWEYLHELLLCYLNLNPKSTHKFIVGAFADLLVSLLSNQTTADKSSRRGESEFGGGGCEISGQHM